ncbi:hypothetical protein EXIGLDRAFT_621476, partial [Exidia glandulosa HHB12029]
SHSSEYIGKLLRKIMEEIGPHKFICAVSDSTGNTKKAREDLALDFPTLLPLADGAHPLNNLLKEIATITYFGPMISQSRRLLKHVRISSFATQRIKAEAQNQGVSRHLEGIGKTRFSSLCRAGHSIIRNLDGIKKLVDGNVIFVTKKERTTFSFMFGRKAFGDYDTTLRQLVGVHTPFAKAIKCIESPQIHAGHVWLFWLAALATVQDLFDTNSTTLELPDEVMVQLTSIINRRYDAMFEGPRNAVYKAALFLDPGACLSSISAANIVETKYSVRLLSSLALDSPPVVPTAVHDVNTPRLRSSCRNPML